MRVLVTGKTGQVATALAERGRADGFEIVHVGRPEVDLTDNRKLTDVIGRFKPHAIVSAAAYTAVDKAESEPDLAFAINATGAGRLATAAKEIGVPFLHLSTDYVFDGSKSTPYLETDPPEPLGVYGRSKLAGERAVAEAQPNHVILRTAWVYSPFGSNFLKTMLRLAADKPQLRVVADQYGNPTSALDIADAVLTIAQNLVAAPDAGHMRGIFHMVGSGEASWAEFARVIVSEAGKHGRFVPDVVPITTAEYPTPAQRPTNSRLDTAKIQEIHGIVLPDWRRSTRQTVERLLSNISPSQH